MKVALDFAFPDLTDDQKSRLGEVASEKLFASGEIIIQQETVHDFLAVVIEGNARVLQKSYDQNNVEFTGPLGPGDVFGEMSFIDCQPSSATLVADGDLRVLCFDREAVAKMIDNDHEFGARFYHSVLLTMCRRIRKTNVRVRSAYQE